MIKFVTVVKEPDREDNISRSLYSLKGTSAGKPELPAFSAEEINPLILTGTNEKNYQLDKGGHGFVYFNRWR
ncbi:MAG: hypothetical protein AB2448_11580 [Moorella sp. (in: firmicutes)]|uniref:hypothetical protein n=1 Tax=Neomoorella mulderi TaxID=202604 RepID=UPI00128FE059|nr:hypothetical protein [Moorella mulderi]